MSSSFKLESHPKKLLKTHLTNVATYSRETILSKEIKNKELYSNVSFLIGMSHDFAKSTTYFQNYLVDHVKTEKARHGLLSSIFCYFCVKSYLKSNNIKNFEHIAPISWLVVLRHHGNLKNIRGIGGELEKLNELDVVKKQLEDIERNNLQEITHIYNEWGVDGASFFNDFDDIVKEIKRDLRKLSRSKKIDNYFTTIFFYSILLDADKMDASGTEIPKKIEISEGIVDDFKEYKFAKIQSGAGEIREKAYEEVINSISSLDLQKDRILSLNLPTGCGKTITAFSFSLKMRKKIKEEYGFSPKIIYSLPFLSIIDQNAEVLSEILRQEHKTDDNEVPSNVFLKHHHLSDISYKTEEELEMNSNQSQLLTEGWHSEIVITTFIQFFYSLLTNKNRAARKFHNITNSIIILDEIQSIPHHYWELFNNTLKYLSNEFNCWVILMTATEPLIFKENEEIKSLVNNKELYFSKFNRLTYTFDLKKRDFEDFKGLVWNKIVSEPKKDIMIVLNTIKSSQELYDYIKSKINEDMYTDDEGVVFTEGTQLMNLSTLIIPDHRLKRIKKIKDVSDKRNIIITTQLVEAGVDISVDIIYRDMAPLDSIVQTAGRCNRSNERGMGSVVVVNLNDSNGRSFYSYIYNSVLINATRDVINGDYLTEEKEFNLSSVPKYYRYILERGSQDKSSDLLRYVEKLNFSDIKKEFKLIENGYEKTDVFVEINEYAKEIWDEYQEIKEIENRFERKNAFSLIKSDFYKYVISVDSKKLGKTFMDSEWLGYVPMNDLNRKYSLETGFISHKEEDVFII
jgi:CRISPR-associated endonuclease/helicase Cas3